MVRWFVIEGSLLGESGERMSPWEPVGRRIWRDYCNRETERDDKRKAGRREGGRLGGGEEEKEEEEEKAERMSEIPTLGKFGAKLFH